MNLRREVLDALEDATKGLCDACLLDRVDAASHQHVNATCRNLEKEGRLIREKRGREECDGCGNVRVINRLVPRPAGTVIPADHERELKRMLRLLSPATPPVATWRGQIENSATPIANDKTLEADFGINEMDALRREMFQFLNKLDPNNPREGFSRRVTILRNDQTLPSTIASLMLTHAAYRNDLYYNSHVLTPEETQILRAIDKCLRSFIRDFKPNPESSN